MKRIVWSFLNIFRGYVRAIANFYDIQLNYHAEAIGRTKLIIEDFDNSKRNFIPKCTIFNTMSGDIYIGRNTGFGHGVMIITGMHMGMCEAKSSGNDFFHVPKSGRDIYIGRNCFIGTGAIILGGTNIGDYSVIGAGAVISKDVPAGSFIVGIPGQVKR